MGIPYFTVLFLRNAFKLNMTLLSSYMSILLMQTPGRSQLDAFPEWVRRTKLSVEMGRHNHGSGVCFVRNTFLIFRKK